ncbi:MAG: iron ABC transporter ATP-binding protein [Rhodoglobus sp.]
MLSRRVLLTALPVLALALLSGCNPVAEPTPTPTRSSTSTPTPTPTPTPTTTAEAGEPITIGCDELVNAQVMYDFNPNFALQNDYTPAAGSLGAQAVAAQGIACSWVNLTSGETIEISAAHLPTDQLEQRSNELVATSNTVPTYDVEGYFIVEGGVGTAQAFDPPYWVTATSVAFFEPGDAAPLMAAALGAVR